MKRIVVTGANKGIGLAIVQAILHDHADTLVYLGARDRERGEAAKESLVANAPALRDRIEPLHIDVASDVSVASAAADLAARLGSERLYAIVNNAGVGGSDIASVLDTNTLGIRRTFDALSLLLAPESSRVVNVTSASGPLFVSACQPEQRAFLLDPELTWPRLSAFVQKCRATAGDPGALSAMGLGTNVYGLSKACANALTGILAREQPHLAINACTPGYIATDMTMGHLAPGQTAADAGMKTPAEGAHAPLHLLFGKLQGNGRYYGSDAKRSPLDRYRAPGSPEHTGD